MTSKLHLWLALFRCAPFQLKSFYQNIDQFTEQDYCLTKDAIKRAVEKDLAWAQCTEHHILTIHDQAYPYWLRAIYDPPPILFVAGDLQSLQRPTLGVVGARDPSSYGLKTGFLLSKSLAGHGLCIISGLARGIDKSAHLGALKYPQGKTIAVLAHGLDTIYPREHRLLSSSIQSRGALVSEFPLGFLPRAFQFPRRNRLISGISMGVLVIEAKIKSGSLITARQAMQEGREVFAVPGQINHELSRGCHALIQEGAKLVVDENDILEELGGLAFSPWHDKTLARPRVAI